MSNLLDQIKEISKPAVKELRSAGFTTDSDIRTLTRQDLLELLPGKENLKVRKKIHELIWNLPQPSKEMHSLDEILKNIRGLIPPDSLQAAFSDNGPLQKYLQVLKDKRVALMTVQQLIEAQIDLLERARGNDVGSNDNVYPTNSSSSANSANSEMFGPPPWYSWTRFWSHQQRQAASTWLDTTATPPRINPSPKMKEQIANVTYKMEVSGKTLDKHLDIIYKLNGPVPGNQVTLQLQEGTYENSQVIIVFCPVVSRAGTDVDAALRRIDSNKPIIVVVMHHMHTPTSFPAPRTSSQVKLGVNVFFHETKGLLYCPQNEEAIAEIKTKLLEYSTKRSCTNM